PRRAQRQRRRGLLLNRTEQPRNVWLVRVWRLARERLVEDDAKRPHVRARINALRIGDLLGRHVRGRSHDVSRLRQLPSVRRARRRTERRDFRDPEVEHLHDERCPPPLFLPLATTLISRQKEI